MILKLGRFKIDILLSLLFVLIVLDYHAYRFSYLIIPFILLISYYKLLIKGDITAAIILILSSRLMMGFMVPGNSMVFNIMNLLCNYLPLFISFIYIYINRKTVIDYKRLYKLKWTILFTTFMVVCALINFEYLRHTLPKEVLPLLFFLGFAFAKGEKYINTDYLLAFFRYTFVACIVVYFMPDFAANMNYMFKNAIIFKEEIGNMAIYVSRVIPRNAGFVFDFRIMGQMACLYMLLLYYTGRQKSYKDLILLCTVILLTFSRGPIVLLLLLIAGIYGPKSIKVTKKGIAIASITLMVLIAGFVVALQNESFNKYVATFNPFSKGNAISQRIGFVNYSLNKFYEKPILGNGLGELSAPNAYNKIFTGITNLHKLMPDRVYYRAVSDAYLPMSLAEKGLLGFLLFVISSIEIFYRKRDLITILFLIGFYTNLIGTDIPKQGFYYFVILLLYYHFTHLNKPQKLEKSV